MAVSINNKFDEIAVVYIGSSTSSNADYELQAVAFSKYEKESFLLAQGFNFNEHQSKIDFIDNKYTTEGPDAFFEVDTINVNNDMEKIAYQQLSIQNEPNRLSYAIKSLHPVLQTNIVTVVMNTSVNDINNNSFHEILFYFPSSPIDEQDQNFLTFFHEQNIGKFYENEKLSNWLLHNKKDLKIIFYWEDDKWGILNFDVTFHYHLKLPEYRDKKISFN